METRRIFQALNGDELKRIVLREIEQAMDNEGSFRQHLAYPLIEWTWDLKVKAYPNNPPEFGVEAKGAVQVPEAEVIQLSGQQRVEVPDQAREEAGLPVPESAITSSLAKALSRKRAVSPVAEEG